MGFAADVVALRDELGGFQHRHVGMGGITNDQLVALGHGPFDITLVHQADLLLAGTEGDLHAIDHDLFGGDGNGHQSGRALTVDGLAAD
ncbi:hypothetical protein D9M71_297340 [compost metagenome]